MDLLSFGMILDGQWIPIHFIKRLIRLKHDKIGDNIDKCLISGHGHKPISM